jgi:hypothetical protein
MLQHVNGVIVPDILKIIALSSSGQSSFSLRLLDPENEGTKLMLLMPACQQHLAVI